MTTFIGYNTVTVLRGKDGNYYDIYSFIKDEEVLTETSRKGAFQIGNHLSKTRKPISLDELYKVCYAEDIVKVFNTFN